MIFRLIAFFALSLVALSACGSGPDGAIVMDRRFFTNEQMSEQAQELRENQPGEILDYYEWLDGEEMVMTILTREQDTETNFSGIFLRHYQLGHPEPTLRWTYQDTLSCLQEKAGAAAGAVKVVNQSPRLEPRGITEKNASEFLLCYELTCAQGAAVAKSLVVIDKTSGTPALRLNGNQDGIQEARALANLPEDTISFLLAAWDGR
ncbi:MAG: hypothetical protein AAGF89_11140 [Bacteroidota bacterium]